MPLHQKSIHQSSEASRFLGQILGSNRPGPTLSGVTSLFQLVFSAILRSLVQSMLVQLLLCVCSCLLASNMVKSCKIHFQGRLSEAAGISWNRVTGGCEHLPTLSGSAEPRFLHAETNHPKIGGTCSTRCTMNFWNRNHRRYKLSTTIWLYNMYVLYKYYNNYMCMLCIYTCIYI